MLQLPANNSNTQYLNSYFSLKVQISPNRHDKILFSDCILVMDFFLELPILCQNNNNLNKKILKFPINIAKRYLEIFM